MSLWLKITCSRQQGGQLGGCEKLASAELRICTECARLGSPSSRCSRTVWEISQKYVIQHAARRQPFICQSQSMNLHLAEPTINKVNSMLFYAWKAQLKTGMYYLRSRPKANPIGVNEIEEETCEACSA